LPPHRQLTRAHPRPTHPRPPHPRPPPPPPPPGPPPPPPTPPPPPLRGFFPGSYPSESQLPQRDPTSRGGGGGGGRGGGGVGGAEGRRGWRVEGVHRQNRTVVLFCAGG